MHTRIEASSLRFCWRVLGALFGLVGLVMYGYGLGLGGHPTDLYAVALAWVSFVLAALSADAGGPD